MSVLRISAILAIVASALTFVLAQGQKCEQQLPALKPKEGVNAAEDATGFFQSNMNLNRASSRAGTGKGKERSPIPSREAQEGHMSSDEGQEEGAEGAAKEVIEAAFVNVESDLKVDLHTQPGVGITYPFYLTKEELIDINTEVVGPQAQVANQEKLASAVRAPDAHTNWPGLAHKCYALARALVGLPRPFLEGNKRTAVRAVVMFVGLNNHIIDPNDAHNVRLWELIDEVAEDANRANRVVNFALAPHFDLPRWIGRLSDLILPQPENRRMNALIPVHRADPDTDTDSDSDSD